MEKAADDFQAVKDCGYTLYKGAGEESYKKLFKVENERCDEMIFSLQCIDHPDYTQKRIEVLVIDAYRRTLQATVWDGTIIS